MFESMTQVYCIHREDNVGTALVGLVPGPVRVLGEVDIHEVAEVACSEPIDAGHKMASRAIAKGEAVVKYGLPIGRATCDIAPGQWVHLHNCESQFDERSNTLDVHTGAPTERDVYR